MTPIGVGSGGLAEAQAVAKKDDVNFVIARVPMGSGQFAREKTVLVTVMGEELSGIKRARIVSKRGDVKRIVGEVHADLSYDSTAEFTMDQVLSDLSKVIASDSTVAGFNMAEFKAQYEAMIAKSKESGATGDDSNPDNALKVGARKTAADFASIKGQDALKAVRDNMGPFNWCLFRGTEAKDDYSGFINAGSLSVPELVKFLPEDDCSFGLIRMGFGTGRFRRTKWIKLEFSPAQLSIVKKAKATASRAPMRGKLGPSSIDLELAEKADLTITAIIDKIKRATVIDGDGADASSRDEISVESFMKALEEEAKASAAFFGDSGDVLNAGAGASSGAVTKSVEEILKELRSTGASTNWAVFTVAA